MTQLLLQVHPVMLAHGSPKTVFIGGGGEGATAREVLKWKSVEKVVMCDIDEVACKICQEQLPEWNAGVYDDPRWGVGQYCMRVHHGILESLRVSVAQNEDGSRGLLWFIREQNVFGHRFRRQLILWSLLPGSMKSRTLLWEGT